MIRSAKFSKSKIKHKFNDYKTFRAIYKVGQWKTRLINDIKNKPDMMATLIKYVD